MKKGFATIIVLLGIITLSIIILTNTIDDKTENYHASIFLDTKNKLSNYSLLLNQTTQNCFLQNEEILNCIDSNSDLILEKIGFKQPPYFCEDVIFSPNGLNNYVGNLNCNTMLYSSDKLLFSNTFSKDIIVIKKATN
jgi:hypothetical protein